MTRHIASQDMAEWPAKEKTPPCRHEKIDIYTDSLGTGRITRQRERCRDCGAEWVYLPCPHCGTLVREDRLPVEVA